MRSAARFSITHESNFGMKPSPDFIDKILFEILKIIFDQLKDTENTRNLKKNYPNLAEDLT
jgi:hypothetical protein